MANAPSELLLEEIRVLKTQLNTLSLLLCILAERNDGELRFSVGELTSGDTFKMDRVDSENEGEIIYRARRTRDAIES